MSKTPAATRLVVNEPDPDVRPGTPATPRIIDDTSPNSGTSADIDPVIAVGPARARSDRFYTVDGSINFIVTYYAGNPHFGNDNTNAPLNVRTPDPIDTMIAALLEEAGTPAHERPIRTAMIRQQLNAPLNAHIILEQAASKEVAEPLRRPLPALTPDQVAAVIARGKEKSWDTHKKAYRGRVFEFVRDTFPEWVGKGLLQSHLKLLKNPKGEPSLYWAFAKDVSRKGRLPDWLDVPTEGDANLRAAVDPLDQAKLKIGREYMKGVVQKHRSRHL